nr:MAG TPA: hypothetical protein [Caudoviricetes sp.]
MFRHDIGDILKHLQREHIQPGGILTVFSDGRFQGFQVLVDVTIELHAIDTGNGGRCPERHLLAVNLNVLNHTHGLTLPISGSFNRGCIFCCRHIHSLVPIGIDRGIRGVSGFRLDQTAHQRGCLDGQGFRLHLTGVLVGLTFNAGTGCGTVIQHMTDVLLVTIELKQEGEGCQFHIGIFNQNTVGIQFLLEGFGTEALRNHCQFQIAVIAHIVVDDIVGNAIGIEVFRLTVCIQGDGNRTGHRCRCAVSNSAVLTDGQHRIVRVFQVVFDFVVLICHSSDLHFKCVQDFVQLLAVNPNFGLVIKNAMLIQHGFHSGLHRQVLQIGVDLDMHFGNLVVDPAICGEVVAAGKQIAKEGRVRGFSFCKMVIGKGNLHFSQHF